MRARVVMLVDQQDSHLIAPAIRPPLRSPSPLAITHGRWSSAEVGGCVRVSIEEGELRRAAALALDPRQRIASGAPHLRPRMVRGACREYGAGAFHTQLPACSPPVESACNDSTECGGRTLGAFSAVFAPSRCWAAGRARQSVACLRARVARERAKQARGRRTTHPCSAALGPVAHGR